MTSFKPRRCPLCNSGSVRGEGPVVHPLKPTVAGVPIDLADIKFCLAKCDNCGLRYKDPPIDAEKLFACYESADPTHWGERPDPRTRRFDVVRDLLRRHASGHEVLDVGCFNGAFLQWLNEDWDKFGVEPNGTAAAIARARGVTIVGKTLDEVLSVSAIRYDAVILFDVVEHIADPRSFFRQARDCLKPGGIWVLVTADTDSFPWRLQGSRHWYCSLPEHVSFYSLNTMRWISAWLEMVELESRLLSHHRSGPSARASECAKNLAYSLAVKAHGLGIPAMRNGILARRAPMWLSARNHRFHVLRRR